MPVNILPAGAAMILAVLMLTACASNEIGDSKDVNQETIYQQYSLYIDEGGDSAEIKAQFRFAGKNGTTLVLNKPSKFELDGQEIAVDSSEAAGAFYTAMIAVSEPAKEHTLAFTDIQEHRYINKIAVRQFRLTGIPGIVSRNDSALIRYEAPALGDGDYIELSTVDADSAFSITRSASDSGNTITVPSAQLRRQKAGQLKLVASIYRQLPLQQQTKQSGSITVLQTTRPVTIILED